LLIERPFSALTVDEIAVRTGLTKSAFLKRFGTKNNALLILYRNYCTEALVAISDLSKKISNFASAEDACIEISKQIQKCHKDHFCVNRAMFELFAKELIPAPETQELFLALVGLMRQVGTVHLVNSKATDVGIFAGTQMIMSLNFSFVMKAMPGLPKDEDARLKLIASIVVLSLTIC